MSKNRKDGKLVKKLDGLHGLIPHIKPSRADSDVYINERFDVTELVKYIEEKKQEEKNFKLTYHHAFVTAIFKLMYNRPLLNRFIINKRFYDRYDITVSFVAKTAFNDKSEETFSVIKANKKDTLKTVAKRTSKQVESVRKQSKNSADKFIEKVGNMPKTFKNILTKILRFMDNHDLIPQELTNNSIYHSSVLVSNLGSINCGAIYHNLTDFGTNSILITIGKIKKEYIINEKGKKEEKYFCDFGINIDERIADGYYFAKSLEYLDYIFKHPTILEGEVSEKIILEDNKNNK